MTSKSQIDPKLSACIEEIRKYILELHELNNNSEVASATSVRVRNSAKAIIGSLQESDFKSVDIQMKNLSYFLIDSGDWSCPSYKIADKIRKTTNSLIQPWKDGESAGTNIYQRTKTNPLPNENHRILFYTSLVLGFIIAAIIAVVIW